MSLPLKDVLAAIDMGSKSVWRELSAEEKKSINFWTLNRYMSSVKGTREQQELMLLKTNEYYNKNYFDVDNHPELMWQCLCIINDSKDIEYHPWISHKRKKSNSKVIKLLEQLYPDKRTDELELLATKYTKKELLKLADEYGIENVKL